MLNPSPAVPLRVQSWNRVKDKTKTQYSENLMKEYTLRIPEDIVRSTKWTLFIEQPDAADSNNVE